MGNKLIGCVALAVLTLGVYWPVHRHEFVNLDDPAYVTSNPWVQQGLSKEGLAWAFKRLHGQGTYWHPVTWVSHMVDCELFGLKAGGHHLVNVVFHACNAVLLFLLFHRMTGAIGRSWFVAALFALHPLQVDTVAWVTERKNVLSTMFWILTLMAYVQYARGTNRTAQREQRQDDSSRPLQRRWMWYALALVLFALGLMSKPMLVTVPCVMLLLDWWPLERMKFKVQSLKLNVKEALPFVLEKAPFFVLAGISSWITVQSHMAIGATDSMKGFPLVLRIENALISYFRYLGKAVWPSDLAVFYPNPRDWPDWQVIASGCLLILATDLIFRRRRTSPYLLVGWLWFLGTLVPTIGLISGGAQSMADRFAYVPLIGLFVIVVWGLATLAVMLGFRRSALQITGAAVLGACIWATSVQVRYWKNSRTLFEHAAAVTKDNYVAYTILGIVSAEEGKLDEAIRYYQLSIEANPHYGENRYHLGNALSKQGKLENAAEEYRKALQVDPRSFEAQLNLAWVLQQLGRVDEAITNYYTALELRPESPDAKYFLGKALDSKGNHAEAMQFFREVAEIRPGWPAVMKAIASTLAQLGKTNEALIECARIVNAAPDDAEGHVLFAQLSDATGNDQRAIEHYRKALSLNAESAGTLNNLAWLLATHSDENLRNGEDAVQLAEKACELTEYKVPLLIGTLAAAYAEVRRFEDAAKMAEKATALGREQGQSELASLNEELAEMYRAGRPYRERKQPRSNQE